MTEELMREAPIERVDGRRIDVRLVAWGDVATRTAEGYAEQIMPGAFRGVDASGVVLESQVHDGAITGVAETIEERDDGAYGTFRVAETAAGDDLLALVRPGPHGEAPVLRSASVVFRPGKSRTTDKGIVQRLDVDLARVAILPRGAYPSAQVVAVRSEPEMTEETQVPEQAPEPEVARAEPVDLSPVMERMEAMDKRMSELATIASVPSSSLGDGPELFRHQALSDYTAAVYNGDESVQAQLGEYLRRAASEQETGNNAGVLPPSWVMDVKRIVNLGRRAISSFGTTALPPTGTTVSWPYLNSSNTLIAAQTEVDEAQSARVDIAKGDGTLETWAGYSMISYQLLQRSEPSYREAYNRILLADWAAKTDAAFCGDLEGATGTTTQTAGAMLGSNVTIQTSAAADDIIDASTHGLSNGDAVVFTALTGGTGLTAGRVYWVIADNLTADDFQVSTVPGGSAVDFTADITAGTVAKVTDTGAKFRAALAQASVSVEDATGQPAGICLVGTDVFLMLAGLSGFQSTQPAGNVSASDGTMLASTLRMESSGLLVQRVPGVSYGKAIISNRMAATWYEDGPKYATAEDVSQLGQYVGVYSFNVPAVFVPAGIVELTLI